MRADQIEALRRAANFSIARARAESGVKISAAGSSWNGAPISGGREGFAKCVSKKTKNAISQSCSSPRRNQYPRSAPWRGGTRLRARPDNQARNRPAFGRYPALRIRNVLRIDRPAVYGRQRERCYLRQALSPARSRCLS